MNAFRNECSLESLSEGNKEQQFRSALPTLVKNTFNTEGGECLIRCNVHVAIVCVFLNLKIDISIIT